MKNIFDKYKTSLKYYVLTNTFSKKMIKTFVKWRLGKAR